MRDRLSRSVIGFWRNVVSGGYRLFRASPLLVADAQAAYDGDQVIDNGDFDWYLEILSVDVVGGPGVGRWLVAQNRDFVAKGVSAHTDW